MNKTCNICGEVKPIGEYYKTGPYFSARCKTCFSAHNAQYYQDNKEARREYMKQHRQDNKEAIAAYRKQHYQDNKEAIDAYIKQHRQDNIEAYKAHDRQYYQDNKEARKQYYQDNKEAIDAYKKQRLQNLPAATYSITNTINRMGYIGQSIQWPIRWKEHKRLLRNNTHVNKHLQQDYNKYGKDAFVFEVLEEYPADTSSELLLERERANIIRSIREHKPLYNTLA